MTDRRKDLDSREGSGVSRTSQVVALIRAGLERPHTPDGDPEAQRSLCAGMRPTSADRLRPRIATRTRFFDGQVLEAVSAGVRQVVVCGAGYDDRALRFRTRGVRFFELDHPATQADKARRLRIMGADMDGLTLVPADFRSDDAVGLLTASGHDPDQPTLFICEGLLVYLGRQLNSQFLAGLRAVAAPESTLAASVAIHDEGTSSERLVSARNANRRTGRVEPWLTILSTGDYLALFRDVGWQVDSSSVPVDLEASGSRSQMLLVAAHPI